MIPRYVARRVAIRDTAIRSEGRAAASVSWRRRGQTSHNSGAHESFDDYGDDDGMVRQVDSEIQDAVEGRVMEIMGGFSTMTKMR